MTFILGVCSFAPAAVPRASIDPMIMAQQQLAPDGVTFRESAHAIFARGLYRQSPEDAFDDQPFLLPDTDRLMAADVRIDNRQQLLDRLGVRSGDPISDSELLCRTYLENGDKIVDLVLGDFAFAAWDGREKRLTLIRDVSGQRPLHYHVGDGFIAFSSMPHGLLAHEAIPTDPDVRMMAEFFADIPRSGARTYFESIKRVEPGHIVEIDRGEIRSRPYWRAPERRAQFSNDEQYRAALREHLERATAARLRGASGAVGAHLSAGLDSSAIATTAARLMQQQQGRVVAFTSAPRSGFDGPVLPGRLADESEIAAKAAALHPNIEHVVVRAEGTSPLDIIRRDSGLFGEPLGLPCNQVWWAGVVEEASNRGLGILLTGESGNLAFSNGGLPILAEFVADHSWSRLWNEAKHLYRGGTRWQGVVGSAFAPWIPNPVWTAVQRWRWGRSTSSSGASLLQPDARAELPAATDPRSRNKRPSVNTRQARVDLLQYLDPGVFRKATLGRWGVEERDPTADKWLFEFCLSLPPEQLLRNGVTRSLARTAFTDRLPPELLHGQRGYQGADWYERVDGAAVCQALDALGDSLASKEIISAEAVRSLAHTWPSEGWATGSVISPYRYALLRAVSAAYFLTAFKDLAESKSLRTPAAVFTGAR